MPRRSFFFREGEPPARGSDGLAEVVEHAGLSGGAGVNLRNRLHMDGATGDVVAGPHDGVHAVFRVGRICGGEVHRERLTLLAERRGALDAEGLHEAGDRPFRLKRGGVASPGG